MKDEIGNKELKMFRKEVFLISTKGLKKVLEPIAAIIKISKTKKKRNVI